jgi:hypothetical protein
MSKKLKKKNVEKLANSLAEIFVLQIELKNQLKKRKNDKSKPNR